jgi:hypothetical protein
MTNIEVGQVLSLKIRYNNNGMISDRKHPYLIVGINRELNTIEIAQLDSLEGKEYKAAMKGNKTIYYDNPVETVIDKDSFIQMDNTIFIDNYDALINYRRQSDKLSQDKLYDTLKSYRDYHEKNSIDENKQVYITKEELENLNCYKTIKIANRF